MTNRYLVIHPNSAFQPTRTKREIVRITNKMACDTHDSTSQICMVCTNKVMYFTNSRNHPIRCGYGTDEVDEETAKILSL